MVNLVFTWCHPAGFLVLCHSWYCVTECVGMGRWVHTESKLPTLSHPHSFSLLNPVLLIGQDVGVEGPHLQQLVLGVGVAPPLGLEVLEHGKAPVHEELDREPLISV